MKKKINKDLNLYFTSNFPKNYTKSNKKYTVILGIGGNIGNVKRRFDLLINMLKNSSQLTLIKTAPILKNPPFGFTNQDYFFNSIIEVKTNLSPRIFLKLCQNYENRLGRVKSFQDAPRTLDIDIILIYKKNKALKINTKDLKVPHIAYKNRQSVLIPLEYFNQILRE